jgi:hypothetical protein
MPVGTGSSFAPVATKLQSDRAVGSRGIVTVLKKSDKSFPAIADRLTAIKNAAEYMLDFVAKCDAKGTRICGSVTDSPDDCVRAWAKQYIEGDAPSLNAAK